MYFAGLQYSQHLALCSTDLGKAFSGECKQSCQPVWTCLQVDSAHENLARVQVRQAAALQTAKQLSEADKSRQKRIKALQTQQTKAR